MKIPDGLTSYRHHAIPLENWIYNTPSPIGKLLHSTISRAFGLLPNVFGSVFRKKVIKRQLGFVHT